MAYEEISTLVCGAEYGSLITIPQGVTWSGRPACQVIAELDCWISLGLLTKEGRAYRKCDAPTEADAARWETVIGADADERFPASPTPLLSALMADTFGI